MTDGEDMLAIRCWDHYGYQIRPQIQTLFSGLKDLHWEYVIGVPESTSSNHVLYGYI
jgi:hypothetical protein